MPFDQKSALQTKSLVTEWMRAQVYQDDDDNPRLKPDASGAFHYRDKKIEIACLLSPREGWMNCALTVHLILRRFPRKLALVFETGYGVDIHAYRPGLWVGYLTEKLQSLTAKQTAAASETNQKATQSPADESFNPIDDTSLFQK